ncbi:hypothetical protein [Agitococcus lubricus]|uniref:Uncharacterized protein n=1 Tax=Agitococcus lubricus TaxID=1077255 RepID=A0A2T5IU37_9GAMM|nr:hypothetical protein [Agitococcus lubricus]PTQ87382.1 hypothetical protein C8N29_11929 [Agitococcus lubricus]
MSTKFVVSLLVMAISTHVYADPALDRMRDQLRQTVLQMRQLEDENLSLKAKLANANTIASAPVVKIVTKDNSAELLKLRTTAQRELEKASALQKQIDEMTQQNQQLQNYLTEVKVMLSHQQQSILALNEKTLWAEKRQKICEQSNQSLLELSQEILQGYQKQNFWQAMRKHEPLLGLYNVKMETILQGYQQKILAAQLTPSVNDNQNQQPVSDSFLP